MAKSSALAQWTPLIQWYTRHKGLILRTSYLILLFASFNSSQPSRSHKRTTDTDTTKSESSKDSGESSTDDNKTPPLDKGKKRPTINRASFVRLLKSMVPTWRSSVPLYFVLQVCLLITRALLTLRVAALDGWLVSAMIRKKTGTFMKLLLQWMLIGIPATMTNALLDFVTNQLSLNINKNLTKDLMEMYMPSKAEDEITKKNPNYYSLVHMPIESKVIDPNQRITTDVTNLSASLASLPNHILKPSLDLILCSFELAKTGSAEGTLLLGILAHTTSLFLRFMSPNFTKIAIERSRLEGLVRTLHARIVLWGEEIGFLRGHPRELDIVDRSYYELEKFTNYELKARAVYDTATDFIVKYTWGAAGLVLCSIPIFVNKFNDIVDQGTSATFITNRRLLLSASSSLGMLITSRKEVQQVVGYMKRISEFKTALVEVDSSANQDSISRGVIKYDDAVIEFKDIPLITPANIVLAKSLSFKIKHGDHLLIAGPNGCGKSSLFRILGGLWPVMSGELTIPHFENMFYLPQRAYLSKSSLKEVIMYPSTTYKYKSNNELTEILKVLDLTFLLHESIAIELAKDNSLEVADVDPFETVRNWSEELSIGVQQRLAMARMYYHKPKFAVLDECTSAVSPQMEQLMYSHAQSLGISLLSVAHRSSLWHFHNYILKFRGDGTYAFQRLDADKRLKWESELMELNKSLRDAPLLEAKLKDLKIAQESQEFRRTQSQMSMVNLNTRAIQSVRS
ncbi:Peroxisomal long-chain fatty acid import protein 1 [Cyberlindnera fabianii]|uniref:Peroxisomal long-chain fatty acid import protein 1 n=1 Tax=Cyberlindnera fabianii TaxID=36022 RepID=A0A1V2L3G1_CYBFA|nr:Peroxisomal long-chain fatty acid import protein 1 [Cyberlindnera fabianii]